LSSLLKRQIEKKDFMPLIYKICPAADWDAAAKAGFYKGSEVDRRDGFIHLSAASQVRETARRHFAGQDGLVLIAFDPDDFCEVLKWEPSRGGDLFPHVYGHLPATRAKWTRPLPLGSDGHVFPEMVPA
jgi:uncharacterized protein (DUF952 family)